MFKLVVSVLLCSLLMACSGGGSSGGNTHPVTPPIQTTPQEIRILILGQSISSNCNQFVYGPVDNVFQIAKDGSVKAAQDPFEWSDCTSGSMWMPLGKSLIASGLATKVTFMPIGVGATMVKDWQSGGKAFDKLNLALDLAKQKGITFDFAFWHQGSSDFGTPRNEYATRLQAVIDYVNKNVQVKRWLIGVHSRCYGRYDPEVEAAQRVVANAPSAGRYLGANSNALGDEYRFDGCHLAQRGQEAMASMWLEAVKGAVAGK